MIKIETTRLFLREFRLSDAASFFDLNADPEVMKYTGDNAFKNISEAENLILNYSDYSKNGFGRWTIILKNTEEILGWCGLKLHPDGMVDIGYRIHQKFWNQGFATESAAACLKWGFEVKAIDEVIGRASKNNLASIRVFEKLGMTYLKDEPCGGIQNSVVYVIKTTKA